MRDLIHRLWRWLTTPRRDTTQEELKRDVDWTAENAGLKDTQPWADPNHDVMGDIRSFIERERERYLHQAPKTPRGPSPDLVIFDEAAALDERSLLSEDEQALWADLTPAAPEKVVAYPPPAEQTTQDWVTERLKTLTGGLTRHPYDLTNYPTPPTEADKAAREYVKDLKGPRALFSHGMSMNYLGELKARAERRDMSLTAEELMGLRARGLA